MNAPAGGVVGGGKTRAGASMCPWERRTPGVYVLISVLQDEDCGQIHLLEGEVILKKEGVPTVFMSLNKERRGEASCIVPKE
jgi:hypothetical protein